METMLLNQNNICRSDR